MLLMKHVLNKIYSLPELLTPYNEKYIFNLDKTGNFFFYKCMPNKTVMFKDETCFGGKLSTEHLTLLQ